MLRFSNTRMICMLFIIAETVNREPHNILILRHKSTIALFPNNWYGQYSGEKKWIKWITPCVLHVPGFPGNIFWICSLLHPLKKWSLRQTRGDSIVETDRKNVLRFFSYHPAKCRFPLDPRPGFLYILDGNKHHDVIGLLSEDFVKGLRPVATPKPRLLKTVVEHGDRPCRKMSGDFFHISSLFSGEG